MDAKPVIIVDHRERDVLASLDAVIEQKQLPVGDFVLSDRVGVERKSVQDFLQSIIDQRIFGQMETLAATFERPLLIVEGPPAGLFNGGIHANAVRGVLASIAIDYKIPIIWTQSTQETARQLEWIARREQLLEKGPPQVRGGRKPQTVAQMQEFLLAGLPGISGTRAKKLLAEFRTPERIFRATEKRLLKVDGFGEKMVKKMKDVLTQEYATSG
ncbi:MAG: hypothetical protein HY369_02740 [Candidatus Aenigmarchaeota archaeon]|nr:hypothetical protein [Candidatus Aenigmarchaeota archaeon]